MDGNEVTVADDGELLVRGPGVFQGYLNDPDATADAFTLDGRFKTGDLGVIEDGFVRIVGRKKDIIVTAGGKNIAPIPIEQALEQSLGATAVVVGDNRPYVVALIALDPDGLAERAAEGEWPDGFEAWTARPEIHAEVAAAVEAVNGTLAPYETIKQWRVLPTPITEENGLLTPTLKLKRQAIAVRFAEEIGGLYA